MTKFWNATRNPFDLTYYLLFEFWDEQGAPHLKGYYTTPLPLIMSSIIYIILIKYILPKYMENRKPYDLKSVMKYYNLINIVSNFVLAASAFYMFDYGRKCWLCQKVEIPMLMLHCGGLAFTALKIFDFLDTIFFILRKKNNQVTTLHVIHHAIMPFSAYAGFKLDGTSTAGFTLMINSFSKFTI